jgi:hypothetical protein
MATDRLRVVARVPGRTEMNIAPDLTMPAGPERRKKAQDHRCTSRPAHLPIELMPSHFKVVSRHALLGGD